MTHERLLTNFERHHLSASSTCFVCLSVEEFICHALRDCSWIESVKRSFIPPKSQDEFFGARFVEDWIILMAVERS